jgi:hypothetical protein
MTGHATIACTGLLSKIGHRADIETRNSAHEIRVRQFQAYTDIAVCRLERRGHMVTSRELGTHLSLGWSESGCASGLPAQQPVDDPRDEQHHGNERTDRVQHPNRGGLFSEVRLSLISAAAAA